MSRHSFLVSMKSTIDKRGYDLAQTIAPGLKFIDLDDTVNVQEFLASGEDAIIWEFLTLDEDPIDPLYSLSFRIGARTSNDPANYSILSFTGIVAEHFSEGQTIDIYDYTGDTVGPTKLGWMLITEVQMEPQDFDKESGIRMVAVLGKAVRETDG